MTSKDYYFDSYAHFGIHEVSGTPPPGHPKSPPDPPKPRGRLWSTWEGVWGGPMTQEML